MLPLYMILERQMRDAGIPVEGVSYNPPWPIPVPPVFAVTYLPEATQEQRDAGAAMVAAFDSSPAGVAAALTVIAREDAQAALDRTKDALGDVLRALVLVLVDELNALRQRCRAQDTAVSGAISLASLQSRWASVATAAPLPDRTGAQARTAIGGKLSDGSADT